MGKGDSNNPCTKDCQDRVVGCKKGCLKYLEYEMFDAKPRKKVRVKGETVINTKPNKRFVPVEVYDYGKQHIKKFDCLADCVRYMTGKYITGKSECALRRGISRVIDKDEMYMGFYFKRLEKTF